MFRIICSCCCMDVRTAPIVFLWWICNSPFSVFSIPVWFQSKVDTPCREEECKYFGFRSHSFVPVIIPLTFYSFVQVSCIQPFFGIFDPVHYLLVYVNSCCTVFYPWLGNAVSIQSECISIRSKCVISFCFQFFSCSFCCIPVFHFLAYFFRIVGSEHIFGNITTIYKKSRAALPCRSSLNSICIRCSCFCKVILICKIFVRINSKICQRHCHIRCCICIFVYIICF